MSVPRFGCLDGFRGMAALSVVLFHLHLNLNQNLSEILPELVATVMSYGYLGVPVFFVISGFVISFSIGKSNVDRKYALNFILRRSVRLDLTYWVSIVLAIVMLWIKLTYVDGLVTMPDGKNVLLHMFYLQDLLQIDPILSAVYWTLCFEVQFYLFFIFSLYLVNKLPKGSGAQLHLFICTSLAIYSLVIDVGIVSDPVKGLFVSKWHYFYLGYLVYKVVARERNSTAFLCWWLSICLFGLWVETKPYIIAAVVFSLVLLLLWSIGLQNSFLSGRAFMFLGAISYPLYLLHADIGWKFMSALHSVDVLSEHRFSALIILILGVLVSVMAAYVLHVFVERPTQKMSKLLKEYGFIESLLLAWRSKS